MRVILMGLRGAGKTGVGRAVAARLGVGFIDLDDETRRDLGCGSIAEAWERFGEAAFREAEAGALRRVLGGGGEMVLGLGGGTPMIPAAAELLRGCRGDGDLVVYLRAEPGELRERLRGGMADRPSLTGGDPLEEIGAVFDRRDAVYRGLAGAVVDTRGMGVDDVVERVCRLSSVSFGN